MANRPQRRCSKCSKPTRNKGGRCDGCKRTKTTSTARQTGVRRPSAAKRGYGRRWQRESKLYLRSHPQCAVCPQESIQPATVVDHIVPHRGDMELFWNVENWQALCASCHNRKSGKGE